MAFELAGARLLMPTFGMGIEVWAAVIATTLGSLALGYWVGGRIADARPSVRTLAMILLLAGASLLGVRSAGQSIPELFTGIPFTAAAWSSAAGVLTAPLLLLGMVQPVLARLMLRSTERTGRVVGGLLAAGTVGGVLGTALTGLVLIPHAGVSRTLLFLGCGTEAMAVTALVGARCRALAGLALLVAAASVSTGSQLEPGPPPLGPMKVLEQVEGRYGHLEVLEHHGLRTLACDGIFQTAIPESGLGIRKGTLIRGREYVELIPYFRPGTRDALLIGLGGGLHEKCLALYGVSVHVVEIEPAVVELAAKYFDLTAEVTVADGRAFLAHNPRRFDVVVLDAFLGANVPEHLYTKEAFEQIAGHLNTDGVLAVHLISEPQHDATRAVARTLQAVFSYTVAARSGLGDELQHVYLFASQAPLEVGPDRFPDLDDYGFTGQEFYRVETEGAPVLTDDRTNLALLSRAGAARHRLLSLQRRKEPW